MTLIHGESHRILNAERGFLHWNAPKTLQKIDKILISSEKPPYTSFLRFRKNSFFREIGPLFPKLEVPPKCASSLFYTVSLDPDDSP